MSPWWASSVHEEARDDLDDLYERETPFWQVMMPLVITAVLLLGAFAIVAWMLWHAGLLAQWRLP